MKNLKIFLFLVLIMGLLTGCGTKSNFVIQETVDDSVDIDFNKVFDDFTSSVEDIRDEKEVERNTLENDKKTVIPFNVSNFTDDDLGLIVDFINVGHGDAILVKSGNEYALIDSGNSYNTKFLEDYISKNTSSLKYFICTNTDEEYFGGSLDILKHFQLETIFMASNAVQNNTFKKFANLINQYNLVVEEPNYMQEYTLGDSSITFLKTDSKESLIVKLTYKDTSFLLMSNAKNNIENELIDSNIDISANVLKVGNHGRIESSSGLFLNRVQPSLAIISAEQNASFEYPHEDVLKKLSDRDILTYITETNGSISVGSNGFNIYAIPQILNEDNTKKDTTDEELNYFEEELENDNSSSTVIYPEDIETFIVYSTRDNKYHNEGCLQLKKVFTQITLGIAKEKGLIPCDECNVPKYR